MRLLGLTYSSKVATFRSGIMILTMMVLVTARADSNAFDVTRFGAVGDGKTDDSSAFVKAWNAICKASSGTPTMVIPKGKAFYVGPTTFSGPCKTNKVTISVEGEVLADNDTRRRVDGTTMTWLAFNGVIGLTISGGGTLNGQGKGWWDIHCRYHSRQGCIKLAPTMLSFMKSSNVEVSNIKMINSPQTHILVFDSQNVEISHVYINSPESSPNTDGIHLSHAQNVFIHDARIATGDDCVSIGDFISNINVSRVDCGPGHGISIGSLGQDASSTVSVEHIYVDHVNFYGTTNGARIKTYQTGTGLVQHIHFRNLNFSSVQNPIIIDQYYCAVPNACPFTKTGVHIHDVVFSNAFGTSKTHVAVNLNCSNSVPCTNIFLETIQLKLEGKNDKATSYCNFAKGVAKGRLNPPSCLKN